MRGLGEGVREFNAAKANIKQEIEEGMKEKPVTTTPTQQATAGESLISILSASGDINCSNGGWQGIASNLRTEMRMI